MFLYHTQIMQLNQHYSLQKLQQTKVQSHCFTVIGGTTFIWDNIIKQDFVYNQISLLDNYCTVSSARRGFHSCISPQQYHTLHQHNTCTQYIPPQKHHTNKHSHNHTTTPLTKLTPRDRVLLVSSEPHYTATQQQVQPTILQISLKS